MAEVKDIVKLAVDAYKGNVEKYSVAQSQEVLRNALIEANNGKTSLDYKSIRDGKCSGLFALIEEILNVTVVEALTQNDFFMAMVDFRNVAEGDKNLFVIKDDTLFVVARAADGTQGVRRQRLGGAKEVSIPTDLKVVRIYEELNRVLSGRVDFNDMINKVAEAFQRRLLDDIFALWNGATAEQLGGITYFPAAGTYSEDDLLDLIAHVEAASGGKTASIIGTRKALRALNGAALSNEAKNNIVEYGYIGKFYGNPMIAVPQRHKIGTTDFVMDDKVLTIIAGDSKPIKCVYEGDPIVLMGDPMNNADLTQEYLFGEKYGLGIVLAANEGIGRYTMS